jgi:hypothetical protein
LIKCAKEALSTFKDAHDSTFLFSNQNPSPLSLQWSKPQQGTFKLNWDAAVDTKQRMIGVGIVARDSDGKVLGVKCSLHRNITNSSVAEAFGARLCAKFGLFLGLKSVVLEGDALEVVQAISRKSADAGYLDNIIGETLYILSYFDRWEVSHVRRTGNMAAHKVAKLALLQQRNHVWLGSFPPCLSSIVLSEC